MLEYAKREIELAKNLERAETGDIDYSGACYDSALKAFESLLGDSHSVYRDWETDRKSTRLNSSHSAKSRMPSSA